MVAATRASSLLAFAIFLFSTSCSVVDGFVMPRTMLPGVSAQLRATSRVSGPGRWVGTISRRHFIAAAPASAVPVVSAKADVGVDVAGAVKAVPLGYQDVTVTNAGVSIPVRCAPSSSHSVFFPRIHFPIQHHHKNDGGDDDDDDTTETSLH